MTWDLSEMDDLIADFVKATRTIPKAIDDVVTKGAVNIKKAWSADVASGGRTKHLQRAVDFDVKPGLMETRAEIGYNKDKIQGPLGNLIEFGGPYNAPGLHGQRALDAEEPKFVQWIEKVSEPW